MTQAVTTDGATSIEAVENVLIGGDLKDLNAEQRITYYRGLCESLGLNPLTRPFEYLTLQGKLVLYARKDATEQLRSVRGVSITRLDREILGDVYVVTATGHCNGRTDMATGAVTIKNLNGDALANAYLKAETKAKRRLTLSICGLGVLDESEVESIPAGDTQPWQEPARVAASERRQLPPPTITQTPAVTQAVDQDRERRRFFGRARELGYGTKREIHTLLALPPEEGALAAWVADGHSWAEALEELEDAHQRALAAADDDLTAPDALPFPDTEQASMPLTEAAAIGGISQRGSH